MNVRLKRKHWIIIGASSTVLLLYFGFYLHYRINNTFIHRAGVYAACSDRRPYWDTNHFIEPSQVADGPEIFAGVMFVAAVASKTNDHSDIDVDKMLAGAVQEVQEMQKRRERLFFLFEPAAFFETLIWKIIEPSPLTRRYKDAEESSAPLPTAPRTGPLEGAH
jgi:hypothetical protein